MIKEGRADPEMFEDINHPIEQVIIFNITLEFENPLKIEVYSRKGNVK